MIQTCSFFVSFGIEAHFMNFVFSPIFFFKFKISNLKKIMLKTDILKKDSNSKSYKQIFSNTAYLDRPYSSPQGYEAIFSNF